MTETVFNDSPVDAAQRWLDIGATRLHVVDLDGAKTGEQVNIDLVERIAALSNVPVQLGGAIRTVEAARRATDVGVDRVIVGTAALEDDEFVLDLCDRIGPDRVVSGVDARNGVCCRSGLDRGERYAGSRPDRPNGGVRRPTYHLHRYKPRRHTDRPNFQQAEELLCAITLQDSGRREASLE